MSTLNDKIENNLGKMHQVLENNSAMLDNFNQTTTRMDNMAEQLNLIVQCLPPDIRLNYQNSQQAMDTTGYSTQE